MSAKKIIMQILNFDFPDEKAEKIAKDFLVFVTNLSIASGIAFFIKEKIDISSMHLYLIICFAIAFSITVVICGIILFFSISNTLDLKEKTKTRICIFLFIGCVLILFSSFVIFAPLK